MIVLIMLGVLILVALGILGYKWHTRVPPPFCDACKESYPWEVGYSKVEIDLPLHDRNGLIVLPVNLLICGVCLHA